MDSSRIYIDEERIRQAREIQEERQKKSKHYIQYRSTRVGGRPEDDIFLSERLDKALRTISDNGWTIDRVDKHEVARAWDANKQKYVPCDEYIIVYHGEVEKE